ncbi:MAG: histidine phosphatase family protein [Myxococcota bacterium]
MSKPAPELLLIRHAESEWNAIGRWQGHADPPLSAQGRAQALALADALARERVDRLEASDLARARQTADALAARWGVAVRTDAIYRELDLGAWSGLTRAEIEARDAARLAPFDAGHPDARAPGGESRSDLAARARAALESLCARCAGERVAVVTHGGFVRALLPELGRDGAVRHAVANASVHRARADQLLAALRARTAGGRAAGGEWRPAGDEPF